MSADQTEITFAEKFFPLIESGQKTTTVRNGIRNYRIGWCDALDPDGNLRTRINVNGIAVCKFGELTDDIAHTDGFFDVVELKNELLSFYPDLTNDSPVTVVHFNE